MFEEVLLGYAGQDRDILEARVQSAWYYAISHPEFWNDAIAIIGESYRRGVTLESARLYHGSDDFPYIQAEIICQSPMEYPLATVSVAETVLATKLGMEAIPVGNIAVRDQWFAE